MFMPLDDYINGLKGRIDSEELKLAQEKRKLELAQRIRANIELTRNSNTSTLNRSYADLSDDPVQQRLGGLPGYIARPLTDKMFDRSMTGREYGIALNGSIRDIVEHVEKLLFMKIIETARTDGLDDALGRYQRFEQNAYRYARRMDLQTSAGNLVSIARNLIGV